MNGQNTKKRKYMKANEGAPSNDKRIQLFEKMIFEDVKRAISDQQSSVQSSSKVQQKVSLLTIAKFMEELGVLFLNYSNQVKECGESIEGSLSTDEKEEKTEPTPSRSAKKNEKEHVAAPNATKIASDLPPQYDKTNSRWTLRHRQGGPWLFQLVDGYKVYVDRRKLVDILNLSNNGVTFARLLLPLIFSESALAVCSLNGDPSLDEDGLNALLSFVTEAVQTRKWGRIDKDNVMKGLKDKLLEKRMLNKQKV